MTFDAAVERLRDIVSTARALQAELPPGIPNIAAARARLAERIPALWEERLIEWPTLADNLRRLGGADAIDSLERSLGGPLVVTMALSGVGTASPLSPGLATLLDYAVRPVLRAGYRATRHLIRDADWNRGTCPACGALPLLAELYSQKHAHSRVLRCGRCSAAWSFERIACPACNERDHNQLRYIHVDGEEGHRRAECCRTCRFYVKAVARLEALGDDALFEADLDTLGLDALALEAGYGRTAG